MWLYFLEKTALLFYNSHILLIGTTYIRDAVIIGFCVNELISITENCGLMGVPLPTPIQKAIDILKSKEE